MLSFWSYISYKEALHPATPAPAGDAQIRPDIQDKSNQFLVKILMGTTKVSSAVFVRGHRPKTKEFSCLSMRVLSIALLQFMP